MLQQGKILNAAMRPQEETNESNLRKRYVNYMRINELRRRRISDTIQKEHEESNIYSAHDCYQVGNVYYGATLLQKIGHSNPNKYGSWWCGPYLVSVVSKLPIVCGFEKIYNEKICNTRHVVLRIL